VENIVTPETPEERRARKAQRQRELRAGAPLMKRGRPPKPAAELSTNPEAVRAREYQARQRAAAEPDPEPVPGEDWSVVYLLVLAKHGNPTLAARRADVTPRTVKKRRAADAEFDHLWCEALDSYLDALEESLGQMNNPIAKIARLRADRKERYLEKLQVAQATVVTHVAPAGFDAAALLKEMLLDIRPETRAALAGEVIDALPIEEQNHGS
jgi:hypothetical protein